MKGVLLERHAFRFGLCLTTNAQIRTIRILVEAHMTDNVEIDPVCGMEVDPAEAVGHSEYEDRVYYFCSKQCQERFDLGPANFADVA